MSRRPGATVDRGGRREPGIAPTAQLTTCCWPLGTPGHSWQIVASSGSSIGAKGMLLAAKALALTGLDLLTKPELLAEAKAELKAHRRAEVPDAAAGRCGAALGCASLHNLYSSCARRSRAPQHKESVPVGGEAAPRPPTMLR